MNLQPDAVVTPGALARGQRALVHDAAWASLTGALAGGVVMASFALWLDAGPLQLGVLACVSLLAQASQVPAIALVERIRQRKRIAVSALTIARTMILLLGVLAFLPPDWNALGWLVLAQFTITALGSVSACAANSWFHQLLPRDSLGSFFSRRLLAATGLACIGTLAAGWLVDHPPGGDRAWAYAILFAAAGVAGFVSSAWLARCPEPPMPQAERVDDWLVSLAAPFRDVEFRRVLRLLGAWSLATNLAAPFLTVFLIRQLGYSLTTVTSLWVASQVANALTLLAWGKVSDRLSNKGILAVALPIYFGCTIGLVLSPAGSPTLQLGLLYAIHVLMGAAAGGIALANGNLGLKLAPTDRGTSYLAAAGLVGALTGGLTSLAGGALADWFASRRLSLTLHWSSPLTTFDVSVVTFTHWEFLFALSAFAGLLAMHALSRIREGTEVSQRQVVQELGLETLRTVQQISSIGGVLGSLVSMGRDALDRIAPERRALPRDFTGRDAERPG